MNLKAFCLALIVCSGFGLFGNATAKAQSDVTSSSIGITVLPAKFELWASAGQDIEQSIKIINEDDSDYIYAISLDNISTTGENGEITVGDNQPNLSNLLTSWVTLDEMNGTLEAKKTKVINFKISIPKNVEFGGKYASLVISADKVVRDAGDSRAIARVVSLLMLTVAGGYGEEAKVSEFNITQQDENINFELKVRNHGLAHVKPEGSIVISNFWGKQIDTIDLNGENILPGSLRRMVSRWDPDKSLFGFYKAAVVANYGQQKDKTITAAKSFSVLPFWPSLLSIIVCLYLVYISLITMLRVTRKKRALNQIET